MRKQINAAFSALALMGVLFAAPWAANTAAAHSTGDEIRKRHGCRHLESHHLRRECRACFRREGRHHFHPRSHRCMRDRPKGHHGHHNRY